MEIRERILALEKEIEGLKVQRVDEDAAASKLLDAIISSIKGDLNHGKNSAIYRGCGYIRQSEVKARVRKATPVVPVSPEIAPPTPPIETGGADGSANSNAA